MDQASASPNIEATNQILCSFAQVINKNRGRMLSDLDSDASDIDNRGFTDISQKSTRVVVMSISSVMGSCKPHKLITYIDKNLTMHCAEEIWDQVAHLCNGTEKVKEVPLAADEFSIEHALDGHTWRRVGIKGTL